MAARFLVAGGTGNWNDNSNWAATSGAASGASFPVAGDAVAFDSNSGNANMTVNVASACASLVVSGTYTGTLTFDAVLTLTSTLTFVSGMTIAGTAGALTWNSGAATLTSAGKTLTCALNLLSLSNTYTLADNWTVDGLVTAGASGGNTSINGNVLNCNGGFTSVAGSGSVRGTTHIKLTGTGSLTTLSNIAIINNLTFDAGAGTITVVAFRTQPQTPNSVQTITYTSGTMVTTGSTLLILLNAGSVVLDTAGMTWGTININSAGSITLAAALHVTDLVFTSGTTTFTGAFDIDTVTMATTGIAPVIALSGNISVSGLWSDTSSTSFTWSGAFDITAGSCTMSGTKTITLPRDITIAGLTTSSDANVINGLNPVGSPTLPFNWNTASLTTTGGLSGTAKLRFNSTGTWTGAAGTLSMNCDIDTSGTLTVSGTALYSTNTLTYVAGTLSGGTISLASGTIGGGNYGTTSITTTGSVTFAGNLSCATYTASAAVTIGSQITCIAFTVNTTGTITLNALLTCTGTTLLPNTNATFAGSSGWTTATLTNTTITATRTYTFQALSTYTVTTAFTTVHAAAQTVRFTFTSSSGSTRALLTLRVAASQDVGFVDPTRIDASGGQPIFTFHGTITDSPNWISTVPVRRGLQASGGNN